jgi:hypothetical protein
LVEVAAHVGSKAVTFYKMIIDNYLSSYFRQRYCTDLGNVLFWIDIAYKYLFPTLDEIGRSDLGAGHEETNKNQRTVFVGGELSLILLRERLDDIPNWQIDEPSF